MRLPTVENLSTLADRFDQLADEIETALAARDRVATLSPSTPTDQE